MICPHLLNRAHSGDALDLAKCLPDESVNCIVTSPPYWGLRDYGVEGQWGLEATPIEYAKRLVSLFRELRRALRSDGTCWLNLGDCYATGAGRVGDHPGGGRQGKNWKGATTSPNRMPLPGLKPKDLVGIPWLVAFALRADSWYLRSDIIWHKPNPMPERVRDRPTKAHEYLFLLTKSERYWYDADAVKEKSTGQTGRAADFKRETKEIIAPGQAELQHRINREPTTDNGYRNLRSVWTFPTQQYSGAHFAAFPEALPTTCILAGCPKGGIVLDPFLGSGTTGQVAQRLGRRWIGFDIDPKNRELIEKRTAQQGLFGDVERSTG